MPTTYYPIGRSSSSSPNYFEFSQGDLTDGKLVVSYAGISSPPAVTVYDDENRRLSPGELDLTPGQSSGQVELNFKSIVFSGICRGKVL